MFDSYVRITSHVDYSALVSGDSVEMQSMFFSAATIAKKMIDLLFNPNKCCKLYLQEVHIFLTVNSSFLHEKLLEIWVKTKGETYWYSYWS